ncbi:MAG TPA: MFS transporter [Eoetvoesiella sp.]
MKGGLALLLTLFIQTASTAAVLAPPAIAPALLASLGLNNQAIGVYISLVYLAAAVAGVYAAAVIRRVGPIRASQLALLLSVGGLLLMATFNPWAATLGAFLVGCGYGPITPASSDILVRTTSPERYSLVFALKQCGVPLGGALAGLLAPPVVLLYGGRAALLAIALLCLISLAAAQWLRGQLDANRDARTPLPTLAAFLVPIRFVLQQPTLRMLCICSFVFSTVQLCVNSYLVTYLNTSLGWSLVAAGIGFSVAQAAGMAGRVGWSIAADRSGKSIETLFVLAVIMALTCGLMVLPDSSTSHSFVMILLISFGVTAIGWNGVYLALVARLAPTGQAASATAGCMFFTYLGVVFGPPLFGAFARWTDDLGLAYAMLIFPLAVVLGVMGKHIRTRARA